MTPTPQYQRIIGAGGRIVKTARDIDARIGGIEEPEELALVLAQVEKAYSDLGKVVDRIKTRAYLAMNGRGLMRVHPDGCALPLKRSFTGETMSTDWKALASAVAAQVSDEATWDKETGERLMETPPPGVIAHMVAEALLDIIPSSSSVRPKVSGLEGRGLTRERYSETFGGRPTVRWEQ